MKQTPRKQYQHSASCMDAETESDEEPEITAAKEVQSTSEEPTCTCIFQLDDWDKWFGPPSPSHLVVPDSDPNSNIYNVQTIPLLATVQTVCIS